MTHSHGEDPGCADAPGRFRRDALGGLLAAGASSALSGLLYGITPFDPVAWALSALTLVAAAAAANFIPARRAMRIDPLRALRAE